MMSQPSEELETSGCVSKPGQKGATVHDAWLVTTLFCAALAIALACLYTLAQPVPIHGIGSVLNVLTLSLFLLLFPQGYRELQYRLKQPVSLNGGMDALLLLGSLACLVGVGWLRPWLPVNPVPLFSGLGVGLLLLCGRRFWKAGGRSPLQWPHILVIALAFVFYLRHGWLVWGSCCLFPRYENRLLAGEVHIDTLFHSDIVALFQTYGVSTTGVDGIPHLPYHIGSHWIFAQLAQLLDISPFQFYNLAYPILILPLLFRSFLAFTLDVRSHWASEYASNLRQDWLFWGLLLIGFTGFMPTRVLDLSTLILSESHLVSISFAFLALSLGLMLQQQMTRASKSFDGKGLVLSIGLGVLLALVTLTKVSVGLLLACAVGYLVLRLRWYTYRWLLPGMGVAIALQFFALRTMGYFGDYSQPPTPWQLGGYLARMDPVRLPLYLLGFFAWSLVYSILRLRLAGITSFKEMRRAIGGQEMVDVEAIALLSGLGLMPAALMAIPGVAAYYFMDLQMWISLALILGNLERFRASARNVGSWNEEVDAP